MASQYQSPGTENLRGNQKIQQGPPAELRGLSGTNCGGTVNSRADAKVTVGTWQRGDSSLDDRPAGVKVFRDGAV